ncbi:MAG: hypothetical protein CMG74_12075 [Candidatus Marinimicrobia bacterium]|nr:hypothetical protein [Candidatus Neomarinimicrobiota bacterium]|tara:strand:- start:6506 stop:8065 length:1560 start_codon:yes stop_codon:yes gene_type:complete
MNQLFAGLDISTQGAKFVVIDLLSESLEYTDTLNYDNDLPEFGTLNGVITKDEDGASESDPIMWITAVEHLFKKAFDQKFPLSHIKEISVSGQQHGLVALDRNGNLAHPLSKLWNDFSTTDECEWLTEKIGGRKAMIDEVSNTQRTGYTAPKILHLFRNYPDNYRKTETLFLVHNYINWYLTGGIIAMEPGDTSGMALWNPVTSSWSKRLLMSIAPDLRKKLPPVTPSNRSIGKISGEFVELFGFSSDCMVDAGSGDNMYGAIGTGNTVPGIVTISLGTSGTAYTIMEEPYVDPSGEIACFCDSTGNYLPLLCVSNMASGYDNFIRENSITHDQFDEIISLTVPGNNGKVMVPWFNGERTPDIPMATPIYFGFGTGDFQKKTIARGLLEGHVLNLYNGFCKLPVSPTVIHLTGGLSRSRSWCQAIADIFHCETVPIKGEGAAMGAALHAAWVWKNENETNVPITDISSPFIKFNNSLRSIPDKRSADMYHGLKELYKAIVFRFQGIESEDPFQLRKNLL